MWRTRALQILLGLMGAFFVAGIYPMITALAQRHQSDYPDEMMLSVYFVLGLFLLLAIKDPPAHRSLIVFTGWANLAHASVMAVQSVQLGIQRSELPPLVGFAAICVLLLSLVPAQQRERQIWAADAAKTA